MKSVSGHISAALLSVAGLVLFSASAISLHRSGNLASDRNPLAIQQSAYGKLLARMSETTIDRVWHLGIEQVTPHGASGCGHEHAPGETCNHDDGADTLTFNVDDKGNIEEESSIEDDHSGHDHGEGTHQQTESNDHDHDHDHSTASPENKFELLGSSPKEWLQNASIVRYKRTNPRSLSDRHLAEIKKDVEQMLLRSYKMDPAHYGAYNSYHLFLTLHDFGGNEQSIRHAKNIAEHTIRVISQEKEDPEAWLTAAAAASNLFFLESGHTKEAGEKMSVESLKSHRGRIAFCLSQFATLQETALKNGVWDGIPTKRQLEIESSSRFALKSFEQFDAMIARAESRPPTNSEGEVIGGIAIP